MLDLSVEALKALMYIQEGLFNEAPKSKFLMLISLQSKVLKVHMQVKQTSSSQVSSYYHYYYYYYQFIFCKVEMIIVPRKTN